MDTLSPEGGRPRLMSAITRWSESDQSTGKSANFGAGREKSSRKKKRDYFYTVNYKDFMGNGTGGGDCEIKLKLLMSFLFHFWIWNFRSEKY